MKKTVAQHILDFHQNLKPNWKLPPGVSLLFPFNQVDTKETMHRFFTKYFNDHDQRILILGINPGRFGAGITGVPFTDPIRLETDCAIINPFKKRAELSSIFIYEFINNFGGVSPFYKHFYISSVCPLGFVKDGKNYNYYDDTKLIKAVEPHIVDNIKQQLDYGFSSKVALCLGQGKNYKYLRKLNDKHAFFETIIPLPHPRWVMQYKRKHIQEFKDVFVEKLNQAILLSS